METKEKTKSTHEKAEKIKKNITGFAEKSKETIRELIGASSKQMETALDANAKIFEGIKKNLHMQEVDEKVTGTLKHTFVKSVELAEDAYDAIINSYTRQMELTVDFNSKLVEAVKESNVDNADRFLELIHENMEASQKLTAENTKEILEFYNKHTNLALNFNTKFADNVNSQVDAMFEIQKKSLQRFTGWAQEWWKQPDEKEKV